MQIIGEEIPLTNGEVFAILRRNRDSRYAKSLPAFGIQSRNLVSNTAQQARPPRNNRPQASRDAIQRALQDFGAQNAVASQEVKGLYYLLRERDCYGVSSVYSSKFAPQVYANQVQDVAQNNDDEENSETNPAHDVSSYFAVSGFGTAGTYRHQLAVHKELEVLEKQGRAKELRLIGRIHEVVKQHSSRMATSSSPSRRDVQQSPSAPFAVSEREVRNLLAVKPKNEAAVAAVLVNLEGRLNSEEAAGAFATALSRIFNHADDDGDSFR